MSERTAKVLELAGIIEAAKGDKLSQMLKDAPKGPDPEQYRKEHGRCPDGYRWSETDKKCVPAKEKKAAEKQKKAELKEKRTVKEQETRKAREERLVKLFETDMDAYREEMTKLREAGELPDPDTARLLVQVDDPDKLPATIRKNPRKLRKIIEQQEAQREHEERVLDNAIKYMEDFEKEREKALEKGKKPPKLDVLKMLTDVETLYQRQVPGKKKAAELLQKNEDLLSEGFRGAKTKPGSSSYRLRKLFERILRPLPRWEPFAKAQVMAETHVNDEPKMWHLGFPPYDELREPRKYLPDQPSGRPQFPPYQPYEPPHDDARDASMQGFPPYSKVEEPFDSKTVGFPPYNEKPAHMSRGFPPFHDGKSVYDHREEAVEHAVG